MLLLQQHILSGIKTLDAPKAKFSVFWRRKEKSTLIICSDLFNCVFDISVLVSAKEENKLSQKAKFWWRHFSYDAILSRKIKKIKLAGCGKNAQTQH